jgi:hypothetical protein
VRDGAARRLADELRRRGLGPAARLLVDAHRPLAPLVADAGAALGPLLRAVGDLGLTDLGRLLEDDGLAQLGAELDDIEGRHAEPG